MIRTLLSLGILFLIFNLNNSALAADTVNTQITDSVTQTNEEKKGSSTTQDNEDTSKVNPQVVDSAEKSPKEDDAMPTPVNGQITDAETKKKDK